MVLNVIHPTMRSYQVLGAQFTMSKPDSFRAGKIRVDEVKKGLNFIAIVLSSFLLVGNH